MSRPAADGPEGMSFMICAEKIKLMSDAAQEEGNFFRKTSIEWRTGWCGQSTGVSLCTRTPKRKKNSHFLRKSTS